MNKCGNKEPPKLGHGLGIQNEAVKKLLPYGAAKAL
jgi:hypothetical protein